MKKIIVILLGAGFCAVLIALVMYVVPHESGEVQLTALAPSAVKVGEPFTVDVSFSNEGTAPAKDARLTLSLPEYLSLVGSPADVRFAEYDIGELAAQGLGKQSFTLIATGGSQSVKHVEAKIAYVGGPNGKTQFEAFDGFDVEIGQPAITLNFETPENVFSGQNFDVVISYENASPSDFEHVRLELELPPVFQFTKSDPKPSQSNNRWELGTLRRREKKSVVMSGAVLGAAETYFRVKAKLSAEFSGRSYTVADQEVAMGISKSPLSLNIEVNRESLGFVARAGEFLDYSFIYKNNSPIVLENLTVTAVLTGEMYNFRTAATTAFFNSLTNTFTWNTANTPGLAQIRPGGSGFVNLRIALRDAFPITRLSDKNYMLKVRAQIESPTVPEQTGAAKTISVTGLESKVQGRITVDASAFYHDADANVVNSGVFPPRINQATQYTIHWKLQNHSTDVSNIRVFAFLQSNTRFVRVIKSTIGAQPRFNAASNEVRWDIANLPATKGLLGDPVEAVFQVENVPAVNQVGQSVEFLSETTIEADDNFVERKLKSSDRQLDTNLPDDTSLVGQNHEVKP
ncbi:MAG: hypothetical protein RL681_12 [Candidatus Parcubacteria bacterium]|jgi:hypothetical protein